jgi:uncharacterized membrane protein
MSNGSSTNALWVWRWVILALATALSVALIVRGNVLIGGLVGALVVARAIVFVRIRRLRQQRGGRFGRRQEPRP